ncbi:MAG: hypothetical protein KGO82_17900 [Bacteroidota bacterium]|nr:hypothetical protein [Bacteroidota bacterium]
MKHSLLFFVLLGVTMLLPAPSKECGNAVIGQAPIQCCGENPEGITPEGAILLSPVKGLLFQTP